MTELDVYLIDKQSKDHVLLTPGSLGYVVVNEFDDWYIMPRSESTDNISILWGTIYYELETDTNRTRWRWPMPKGDRWDELRDGRRSSGSLSFYRKGIDGYYELRPKLFILAESLLHNEYVLLLDRIGQLAVAQQGSVVAPIATQVPVLSQVGGEWLQTPLVERVLSLLQFYNVLQRYFPDIERYPAMEMKKSFERVSVFSPRASRSSLGTRQISSQPGHTHVSMPLLTASTDCPENRFLALALDRLRMRAMYERRALQEKASLIKSHGGEPPGSEREAVRVWRQGTATANDAVQALLGLAERLKGVEVWATSTLKHELLRSVAAKYPRHPSIRLTRGPGYSPVFHAYHRSFNVHDVELKLDQLRVGLLERRVKPTIELYEVWVFFEVYAILVERFGFEPADGGPAVHLEMKSGRVQLQRRNRYELQLRLDNADKDIYRIFLTYEPKDYYSACGPSKRCFDEQVCTQLRCWQDTQRQDERGPDVFMETEYKGNHKRYALDAKYRRYQIQRPTQREVEKYRYEDTFTTDILGHAKQKYLDGKQYDAAFVIHSDSTKRSYFGEAPFPTVPHRENTLGYTNVYPSHQYGAVFAVPRKTEDLEKLIRCLLMYHAQWYDICWVCRKRLQPKQVIGRAGRYFQCDAGHAFWVKSNCTGPDKHPLIKLGNDSFHRTKDVWNCTCPTCGDELPPQRRNFPSLEMPF